MLTGGKDLYVGNIHWFPFTKEKHGKTELAALIDLHIYIYIYIPGNRLGG